MKKIFLLVCFWILYACTYAETWVVLDQAVEQKNTVPDVGYDGEFLQALVWMHDRGMTRYETSKEFRPYDLLSRQEAAKFFSQFTKEVLYKVLDQTRYCVFDDLGWVDPTLKNAILESCMLHVFWWSAGNFFPHDVFTKWQAMTVLIRALDGYKEETWTYRRTNYRQRAWDLGLTIDSEIGNGEFAVTRYEVALLLYRAGKLVESDQE